MKHTALLFLLAALVLAAFPTLAQDDTTCEAGVNYERRVESALEEDAYEAAIEAYSCLIEATPDDTEAYMGRAVAMMKIAAADSDFSYFAMNDIGAIIALGDFALFEQTIADLSDEIDENPDDAGAYVARGFLYFVAGRQDDAMADYERVIELDPQNPVGYLYRGTANHFQGDTARATPDYAFAVAVGGNNAGLYAQIATSYLTMREFDIARQYMNVAIELDPENTIYYVSRGFTYLAASDIEAAVEDFSTVIELDPDNAFAYGLRADAYNGLEDYERAIADYTTAIELAPENAEVYGSRAWTYMRMDEFEMADEDFTSGIRLDPANRALYQGRAAARTQLGDLEDAAEDFAVYVDLLEMSSDEAGALENGDRVSFVMSEGHVVRLTFEAEEDDVITVRAESPDGAVDTFLLLENEDGDPLAGNDDPELFGEDLNAAIVGFEAPSAGEYVVAVTHAGGGSEGEVEVTLEIEG